MKEDQLSTSGVEPCQDEGNQKTVVDPDFTVEVIREGDAYSTVETKVVTRSDGAIVVRILIEG